jgi:hypothetical protein
MEENPEATSPQPQGTPSRRRRFLQQGLAGGSIALLASTHRVLAGGTCKTPVRTFSGYTSCVANPSTSQKTGNYSTSKSPGYWAPPGNPNLNLSHWPIPSNTKFTTKFGGSYPARGSKVGANSTMLDVIKTTTGGDANARQFAAALLDALSDPTFPASALDIVTFWQKNYNNSGQLTAFVAYLSTVET